MHYYQFNIGDYATHTRHLSPIEDITYRRILDLAYTTEQPLTKDIHVLSRLINLREYQQEIKDVLSEFFLEVDDGWISNRVCKEILKTGKKSAAARHSVAISAIFILITWLLDVVYRRVERLAGFIGESDSNVGLGVDHSELYAKIVQFSYPQKSYN